MIPPSHQDGPVLGSCRPWKIKASLRRPKRRVGKLLSHGATVSTQVFGEYIAIES